MTPSRHPTRALVADLPDWVPLLIDAGLILLAFLLGHYVRYTLQWLRPVNEANIAPFEPFVPYALIFALWLLSSLHQRGVYHAVRGRSWSEEAIAIANGTAAALVLVMACCCFTARSSPGFS
jgi:hypothetical protein